MCFPQHMGVAKCGAIPLVVWLGVRPRAEKLGRSSNVVNSVLEVPRLSLPSVRQGNARG